MGLKLFRDGRTSRDAVAWELDMEPWLLTYCLGNLSSKDIWNVAKAVFALLPDPESANEHMRTEMEKWKNTLYRQTYKEAYKKRIVKSMKSHIKKVSSWECRIS